MTEARKDEVTLRKAARHYHTLLGLGAEITRLSPTRRAGRTIFSVIETMASGHNPVLSSPNTPKPCGTAFLRRANAT